MAITLPLDSMTVEEKILAMETLWDSLCARADNIEAPTWHGEALAGRELALQSGEDQFEDWEQAKKQLRKLTS